MLDRMILSQFIKNHNGKIVPLLLPKEIMKGPSLANVSILNINDKLIINIRNLNYVLYHAENTRNAHAWGPLVYVHPEKDQTLTTYNYLCELDDNYNIISTNLVDTSGHDVPPLWEFVGLEDARLAFWDRKLFLCGVRRDTTINGVGRMELSEIIKISNDIKEISRVRMPAPAPNNSYCEKNWMPIADKPFYFMKWTNPVEVVKYDHDSNNTYTMIAKEYKNFGTGDLRGGSQIIPYMDYYIAIVHEVDLYYSEAGRKDATYVHRVVLWDKEFNILNVSKPFSFLDGKIEFCVGLTMFNNKFVATFGFQDNAAFLCEIPIPLMNELVGI